MRHPDRGPYLHSRRRSHQTVGDRSAEEESLQKKRRSGFERGAEAEEAETGRVLTICQLEDINPDVVPSRPGGRRFYESGTVGDKNCFGQKQNPRE